MNVKVTLMVVRLAAFGLAAAVALPQDRQASTLASGQIWLAAEKQKVSKPAKIETKPDNRVETDKGEPMSEADQKEFEGIFDDVNEKPIPPPCRDKKDDC